MVVKELRINYQLINGHLVFSAIQFLATSTKETRGLAVGGRTNVLTGLLTLGKSKVGGTSSLDHEPTNY